MQKDKMYSEFEEQERWYVAEEASLFITALLLFVNLPVGDYCRYPAVLCTAQQK